MSEQQWQEYMSLLEQENTASQAHCVGCWYEEHAEAFPALDSSSLCTTHAEATRQGYHMQERGAQ
jgi:hypothetical protein